MTDPDSALVRAREAAARMRAGGGYSEDVTRMELEPEEVTTVKLFEWAVIEPDVRNVRSTRRLGAPMTTLKRALLRLLAQYHAELLAQQTRFNVNLVRHTRLLERRIDELERRHRDEGRR